MRVKGNNSYKRHLSKITVIKDSDGEKLVKVSERK